MALQELRYRSCQYFKAFLITCTVFLEMIGSFRNSVMNATPLCILPAADCLVYWVLQSPM